MELPYLVWQKSNNDFIFFNRSIMNKVGKPGIGVFSLLFISLVSFCTNLEGINFGNKETDTWFAFSGSFKPEFFCGKNINLLNNNNSADRIFYFRHSLDLKLDASYGRDKYGHDIIYTRFAPRNKAVWGDPKSYLQTTDSSIKALEVVSGPHHHFNPRLFFWIREVWIELDLNDVFNWHTLSRHTFTLGAFRFQLGRGIALGNAYAVGPGVLGFYTDSAVDQYAFGGKLSGDIIENRFTYDLYGAILENKTSNISDTAERILGQEYGCRMLPERGFGKINFVVAGCLNWTAVNIPNYCRVTFEPYWLYNDQPEQRVEFLGDASSILGTLGVASEYEGERFEFGFEYAVNLGKQKVKGWDRNGTQLNNNNSTETILNTHIIYFNTDNLNDPQNNKKIPYIPNGKAQTIIEESPQNETQNGKLIGIVNENLGSLTAPVYLVNSGVKYINPKNEELIITEGRFRDPYTNKLEGWMFVADAAWWNQAKDLNVAAAFGFASGDNNPNEATKDGVYSGFIGLQEIYSGKDKRVRSAFILGSSGKLKRPLAFPLSQRPRGRFARTVSGFTNLIFTGGAIYWQPNKWEGKVTLHPNMIFYWQDMPTRGYDATTDRETKYYASKFLGTEFSLFFDYYLKPPLRFYLVGAIFIPGTHFSDIRGKPISAIQSRAIADRLKQFDRPDTTGFLREQIPNLGDNTAISFNLGIEYKF